MYADEAEGKKLRLYVYAGDDAYFRYYEDSGDGYGYEKGEYAMTEFIYMEHSGTLIQKDRKGSYPGMKGLVVETEIIDTKKKQE